MKINRLIVGMMGVVFSIMFSISAIAAEKIRIAYIDPLSGAFADVGEVGLRHFKFFTDKVNTEGGVLGGKQFEIVAFDNKISSKESLVQLKRAIDQGIRYITQANGSSVAVALLGAIKKHNKRNPDKPVLFINYGAVTPSLTEDKCNFWHFRFDAHVDMKMQAITEAIKLNSKIKRVYILGQDYVYGHAVAKAAKRMLAIKRPDIKIVGETYHPINKVKDFSSYVAKIRRTNADAVITGNWGADMTLLGKAVNQAGLKSPLYTFYAGGFGSPRAMGRALNGLIQVNEWHPNLSFELGHAEDNRDIQGYYRKYSDGGKAMLYYGKVRVVMEMLVKAFNKAGSTEPLEVAYALEGMVHDTYYGKVIMNAHDHQLLQPLWISRFTKVNNVDVKNDTDSTGYGPKTMVKVDAVNTATQSSCKMVRPRR